MFGGILGTILDAAVKPVEIIVTVANEVVSEVHEITKGGRQ